MYDILMRKRLHFFIIRKGIIFSCSRQTLIESGNTVQSNSNGGSWMKWTGELVLHVRFENTSINQQVDLNENVDIKKEISLFTAMHSCTHHHNFLLQANMVWQKQALI